MKIKPKKLYKTNGTSFYYDNELGDKIMLTATNDLVYILEAERQIFNTFKVKGLLKDGIGFRIVHESWLTEL
jgi:hypothetical protein